MHSPLSPVPPPSRRFFLRAAGRCAAGCAIARSAGAALPDPAPGTDEILDGIEGRIDRHRTGKAVLAPIAPGGRPLPAGASLRVEQTRHRVLFGCNLFKLGGCRTPAENDLYAERFARLFNFATLPFYWWSCEPERGRTDETALRRMTDWCARHRIAAKGHPLAWNWIDPSWLAGATPARAMEAQFARIADCVARFKGVINLWDAVNEATDFDREHTRTRAPILTTGIRTIGVRDYLQRAFRAARRAHPGARLLINDYRTDRSYGERVLSQLAGDDGRPLFDAIGIQSHMHLGPEGPWPARKTWEVCERFAAFGRPLHFTETTLVSGTRGAGPGRGGWTRTNPEGERAQADAAAAFYRLLFSHPAVEAVTWWDFSDQGAWLGAPAGLIRDDMSPKPVYEQLHTLIRDRWWTSTRTRVAPDGTARFRGFFGDYSVSARVEGRDVAATFPFDPGATGRRIGIQLA